MTSKVKSSGVTVAEALQEVANQLSLTIQELDYEVIREQFFGEDGTRQGVDIVEIEAWIKEKIDTSKIEAARDWLQQLLDLIWGAEKQLLLVTLKKKNQRSFFVHLEGSLKDLEVDILLQKMLGPLLKIWTM